MPQIHCLVSQPAGDHGDIVHLLLIAVAIFHFNSGADVIGCKKDICSGFLN